MKQRHFRWAMILLTAVLLVGLLAVPASAAPSAAAEKVDVLIGFHGNPNPGLVRVFGGEIYAEFSIVDVIAARVPQRQVAALANNPNVRYVEPDKPMQTTQTVPWGIDRIFGSETYSFDTWKTSTGAGIGVAVLDTGIDGNHIDLPRLTDGTNTVDNTPYNSDIRSHGTHVAGTIGALNNTIGVVGVATAIKLYSVKVISDSGSGTTSTVIAGIQWVVDNHMDEAGKQIIHVINMSLSGGSTTSMRDACAAAYADGILLVASAGNGGNAEGSGDNVRYPAAYDSVVAVAASDSNNKRASFSSTGPAVELIAPGVSILSTNPNNEYGYKSGTSMASPHVAGVAALVWGANPSLSNTQVRDILRETAESLGISSNHQGHGLVRADLAVKEAGSVSTTVPVKSVSIGEGDQSIKINDTVKLTATVSPADSTNKNVSWSSDNTTAVTVNQDGLVTGKAAGTAIVTVTTEDGGKTDSILVEVQAADNAGQVELIVEITSPKDQSYTLNSWVDIIISVTDLNTSAIIPGATVTATVTDPKGSTVGTYQATYANGVYTARYRIPNRATTGLYKIEATAFLENALPATHTAYFSVSRR